MKTENNTLERKYMEELFCSSAYTILINVTQMMVGKQWVKS